MTPKDTHTVVNFGPDPKDSETRPLPFRKNKVFMGRVFLSLVKFSPEQGTQFWVNIGWNTAEN